MNSEYLIDAGIAQHEPWDEEVQFARDIAESGEYALKMIPFPGRAHIQVAGYETVTQTISVKPKSYIQAINCWTDLPTGFFFSICDKGSRSYLVNEEYITGAQVGGSSELAETQPFRQGWLNGPYLVSGSGELQLSATNLMAGTGNIQTLLFFAEPLTEE